MTAVTAEAVRQRVTGQRVSRGRALLVAAVAGTGTAVVVYKLLRADSTAD
jgi:hypothetical protein